MSDHCYLKLKPAKKRSDCWVSQFQILMIKKPILGKFVNIASFLCHSNFQIPIIWEMISNFGKGPFLGCHREKRTIFGMDGQFLIMQIYHYVADIWLSICIYVMRMRQTHHLTYPYSSCIKLTTHLNYIWSDTETYNYTSPEHILDLSTSFKDLSSSMPRNQWKWSSCPTNKKSHANSEPFFQPM